MVSTVSPLNMAAKPAKNHHRPMLLTPFYARHNKDEQSPQIHEYRNADYMTQFSEDLQQNRLTASKQQDWYETNKLDGKSWPVLRLPIHKGFYLVSCELSCDNKNRAPVDPKRISEAWMTVSNFDQEVDINKLPSNKARQMFQAVLLQAKQQGNAYPLRPVVTQDNKGIKHTVLSGFLPLSDVVNNDRNNNEQLIDVEQVNATASEMAESFADSEFISQVDQVLWSGASDKTLNVRLKNLVQLLDENLAIGVVDNKLAYTAVVTADTASSSVDSTVSIQQWQNWLQQSYFYEIPSQTNRQHLYSMQLQFKVRWNQIAAKLQDDPPVQVTQAYRNAYNAFRQTLLNVSMPSLTHRELTFNSRYDFSVERISTVTSPWIQYLSTLSTLLEALRTEVFKPQNMLAELSDLRLSIESFKNKLELTLAAAQALNRQFQPRHKYRRQSFLQWLISGRDNEDKALSEQLPVNQKLIVSADWIRKGPELISKRWIMLVNSFTREWQTTGQTKALSKEDDQLYQVRVYAKVIADNGCEYLVQSQLGEPFYIASFYETRLMPSYPIKMPTLKDLKKAVSGPAMIMPSDLAKKVNKLKFPDGEVEQSGSGGEGRWIYMFSIPIVTICAMILLMLIINILNFVFRWIPYAILRIPFPK
jgi:hypothetical protein